MLNVKPLGSDENKSVYWYFGSSKLYREDFENSFDISTNLPVNHVSTMGFIIYFVYLYLIFKSFKKSITEQICMHYYIFRLTK